MLTRPVPLRLRTRRPLLYSPRPPILPPRPDPRQRDRKRRPQLSRERRRSLSHQRRRQVCRPGRRCPIRQLRPRPLPHFDLSLLRSQWDLPAWGWGQSRGHLRHDHAMPGSWRAASASLTRTKPRCCTSTAHVAITGAAPPGLRPASGLVQLYLPGVTLTMASASCSSLGLSATSTTSRGSLPAAGESAGSHASHTFAVPPYPVERRRLSLCPPRHSNGAATPCPLGNTPTRSLRCHPHPRIQHLLLPPRGMGMVLSPNAPWVLSMPTSRGLTSRHVSLQLLHPQALL